MAYRLGPQVEADLEDLTFYVFLESGPIEIADRLTGSVTERLDLLEAHPRAGRAGRPAACAAFLCASTSFSTASPSLRRSKPLRGHAAYSVTDPRPGNHPRGQRVDFLLQLADPCLFRSELMLQPIHRLGDPLHEPVELFEFEPRDSHSELGRALSPLRRPPLAHIWSPISTLGVFRS